MEKIAILSIEELGTRLVIYETRHGRYQIIKENFDSFPIGEDIFKDQLIKPKTVSKVVSNLIVYREMIQSYGVERIIGVAKSYIAKARNQKGFFEELYNNTGVAFTILDQEDNFRYLFNSMNSTIDISKAIGIYVDKYFTYIQKYNRRTMIDTVVIPYGTENIRILSNVNEMIATFKKELVNANFVFEGGDSLVGSGDAFINFGRLAKKIAHYPVDIDNNYQIDEKTAKDTFTFIKGLDLEKVTKIKGMIGDVNSLLAGLAIIEACCEVGKFNDILISTANIMNGIISMNVEGETQEKYADVLGNSFDNYFEFHKKEDSNNIKVYNMATILFKQLKVMHKLPRAYVKPMRAAAYMYDCGKAVNFYDYEKFGLYTLLNSGVCGVSQKDLLLAGFIIVCQKPDNFSLAEWMRYKDIVTEEDLDAVRKLGIIVKLAVALNSSKKQLVNDIVCDILGDSIIMKTIASGDASYDIMQGMRVAQDYRKVFKKNLQII